MVRDIGQVRDVLAFGCGFKSVFFFSFHFCFFCLTTRAGELVLAELRQNSPRAGESHGRFVQWLGMVHFVAPEAVGLVKADDDDKEAEDKE